MSAQQVDYLSLHGKRVLVVEEDDQLFCALRNALHDAGCETLGLPSNIPDTLFAVPESHVDAALLDIDPHSQMGASLANRLSERGVPILLICERGPDRRPERAPERGRAAGLPVSFRAPRHLRKPFTEQELLDGIARAMHIDESSLPSG